MSVRNKPSTKKMTKKEKILIVIGMVLSFIALIMSILFYVFLNRQDEIYIAFMIVQLILWTVIGAGFGADILYY